MVLLMILVPSIKFVDIYRSKYSRHSQITTAMKRKLPSSILGFNSNNRNNGETNTKLSNENENPVQHTTPSYIKHLSLPQHIKVTYCQTTRECTQCCNRMLTFLERVYTKEKYNCAVLSLHYYF